MIHVSDNREPLCGAEKSWLTGQCRLEEDVV